MAIWVANRKASGALFQGGDHQYPCLRILSLCVKHLLFSSVIVYQGGVLVLPQEFRFPRGARLSQTVVSV